MKELIIKELKEQYSSVNKESYNIEDETKILISELLVIEKKIPKLREKAYPVGSVDDVSVFQNLLQLKRDVNSKINRLEKKRTRLQKSLSAIRYYELIINKTSILFKRF